MHRIEHGKYLSNGLWFIPDVYIYNSKTKKIDLAFPEEMIPPSVEFDWKAGNKKIINKFRYLCRECGHKWLNGFNNGTCPECGAKFKVKLITIMKSRTYYIEDDPVVGPVGDYEEYNKVKKYIQKRWRIRL